VVSLADSDDADTRWDAPPPTLSLGHDEVHVWRLTLDLPDDSLGRLWVTLAEDERGRASRFHFERHRKRFVAGRGQVRAVLACYLDREPAGLRFSYGLHGKPALAGAGGDLQFNQSHSAGAALLAVTRGREVGVDLEQVRPREHFEALARRFFAPAEVAALAAVPAAQRELAFYQCWTRKEAFLKAGGEGLARPLDQFTVSLGPGEAARLLAVRGDPEEAPRWALRPLTPWPGFVACVALRGHGWGLRCWDGAGVH
jgi:4'-phosphopantetheinyl transferase